MNITIEIWKGNGRHLTRRSWARVRAVIKLRDMAVCQYCGKPANDGEPDHILPLAQGGNDALHNLVWSCKDCNRAKGEMTLRAWVQSMLKAEPPLPPLPKVRRYSSLDAGDVIDV